jgi:hypothetical protein
MGHRRLRAGEFNAEASWHATKEKPHRTGPKTFGTQSDAARPGLGWDPASGYLIEIKTV